MKNRFSTIDIVAIIAELKKYVGMRVNKVYDVDTKTYLFKLNRQEEKVTLLIESGIRIHSTEFEWPKSHLPSGFSMKLRKHVKNKRLESISQVGTDRIVDIKFGSNEVACHVIVELYDKGNIVLTDYEYIILDILRPRATGCEDVKFMVRERYPIEIAQHVGTSIIREKVYDALKSAKDGTNVKKLLMPLLPYGPAVIDHILSKSKFPKNCSIGKTFNVSADINNLFQCLDEGEELMETVKKVCKGYIIHKVEKATDSLGKDIITNTEFHPFHFNQHASFKYTEYDSFNKAVDYFFSGLEGQKIDIKALQREREAMKKLENVRKDHEQRLGKLFNDQQEDIKKAQLIEMNLSLVDEAILIVCNAIAHQINWSDIKELVREAQAENDCVAMAIKELKLDINHITLYLQDPYIENSDAENKNVDITESAVVDIDLDLSAYANARKYYDLKRHHAKKEQKTLESSEKAFKSAERKTKQVLKEVAVTSSITKVRKSFWFEKFLWFISSENYLIIAGHDIQQNELLVKRYLKQGDIYVHADIHGASSVIIKNSQSTDVPPKTLNEAGTLAMCHSSAWDAKIITSAWWVYHHQVSKTAPTGEYLTPGSFMIRGKKNYLPPSYLVMGFGLLFKVDEDSVERHKGERQVKHDVSEAEIVDLSEDEIESGSEESVSDKSIDSTTIDHENLNAEDESDSEDRENLKAEGKSDSEEQDSISNPVSSTFPDTKINLNISQSRANICNQDKISDFCDMVIPLPRKMKREITIKKSNQVQVEDELKTCKKDKQTGPKRGQKSKLKKIKEKYKYQDEEERELRMKILASAGEAKASKKSKQKKSSNFKVNKDAAVKEKPGIKESQNLEIPGKTNETLLPRDNPSSVIPNCLRPSETSVASDDEVEETEGGNSSSSEIHILNMLTGLPLSDDGLIFAVPVCAPYQAMQNYKFKIKLLPGTGRKGKASKTALQMFLHDKTATPREKDLLRSIKDQDISRNFPGKVKLSAPNLKKMK